MFFPTRFDQNCQAAFDQWVQASPELINVDEKLKYKVNSKVKFKSISVPDATCERVKID